MQVGLYELTGIRLARLALHFTLIVESIIIGGEIQMRGDALYASPRKNHGKNSRLTKRSLKRS